MAINIDQEFLADSARESEERAGELAEAKRQALYSSAGEEGRDETGDDQAQSLREAVLDAKRKKKAGENKNGDKVLSPIRRTTSRLLRQSWLHIIDSYGLTFIWVNVHAFLSNVLGEKVFCKLGHEWSDMASSELADNPAIEAAKQRAAVVEKMGVGCIDAVLIILLLFVIGIIALMLDVVSNPMSNLKTLASFAWKWVTGTGITAK